MRSSQEIANVIRELLKERKTNVSIMLEACSLQKDTIGNMDRGSMISADKLGKIALYLGVSADYLLGI